MGQLRTQTLAEYYSVFWFLAIPYSVALLEGDGIKAYSHEDTKFDLLINNFKTNLLKFLFYLKILKIVNRNAGNQRHAA